MTLNEYLTCFTLYYGVINTDMYCKRPKESFKIMCFMIGKKADMILTFILVVPKWSLTTHIVLSVHLYKGDIEGVLTCSSLYSGHVKDTYILETTQRIV